LEAKDSRWLLHHSFEERLRFVEWVRLRFKRRKLYVQ
jgi:hypothetical protein